MDTTSKLALGTVQFGLDYGISNTRGQVPPKQVCAILDCCRQHQIDTLDTAAAYGESERILGRALQSQDPYFRVISKTVPGSTAAQVEPHLKQSLQRLQVDRLQGYLVHDFPAYEKDPGIYKQMQRLQDTGLAEKTGFSLYYPGQLQLILDKKLSFQLIQIPYNVFDQRFASFFPLLAELGVEVHVRSVFLQGLLFQDPHRLPAFFDPLKENLRALHQLGRKSQLPLTSLLLGFAHLQPEISKLVTGVTSVEELQQNIAYTQHLSQVQALQEDLAQLAVKQENLILPFNWNKP